MLDLFMVSWVQRDEQHKPSYGLPNKLLRSSTPESLGQGDKGPVTTRHLA